MISITCGLFGWEGCNFAPKKPRKPIIEENAYNGVRETLLDYR